jgi:hypothetical protein
VGGVRGEGGWKIGLPRLHHSEDEQGCQTVCDVVRGVRGLDLDGFEDVDDALDKSLTRFLRRYYTLCLTCNQTGSHDGAQAGFTLPGHGQFPEDRDRI